MKQYFTKTGNELTVITGQNECAMEREYETEYNREAMRLVDGSFTLNRQLLKYPSKINFIETKQESSPAPINAKEFYDAIILDYFRNGGR